MSVAEGAVAAEGPTSTLGRDLRRGGMWSSLSSVALRMGTFLMGIVAARLIAPEQFGVFTVALTVHAVVLNISDVGVGAYLVRHQGDPDEVAPTVLAVCLSTSGALALAMFAGAPLLATSLGSAEATAPVRVLALTVLLAGPSAVPNSLLVRAFRQDRIFASQVVSFLSANGTLVLLALGGAGAMGLAWSRVAGHLAQTAVLIVLAGRMYWPRIDRGQVGTILRFGLPLAGFSLLGFASGNIDFMVIGRLLGAEPLGLFTLAYNVSGWGYGFIAPVVAAVAMPAFARIRSDKARLPEFVATALSAVLCLALPVSAMIAALSEPLVGALYGPEWMGAVAALAVTAAYGALRIPCDLFVNIGVAMGRTRAMFVVQFLYFLAMIPAMVVGVRLQGIVGAGYGHIVGISVTLLPGLLYVAVVTTGTPLRRLVAATIPPLGAATVAGLAAWSVSRALTGYWLQLVVAGLAGLIVYVAALGPWLVRTLPAARLLWRAGDAATEAHPPMTFPAEPGE